MCRGGIYQAQVLFNHEMEFGLLLGERNPFTQTSPPMYKTDNCTSSSSVWPPRTPGLFCLEIVAILEVLQLAEER